MKVKMIYEGREIEVDVPDEEFNKLIAKKRTGYERHEGEGQYFYEDPFGEPSSVTDYHNGDDNELCYKANYTTDKQLCKDNARADKLMRQLRRFSATHRDTALDWTNPYQHKYYIYHADGLKVGHIGAYRHPFQIYFDSEETAQEAREEFYDELVWYFAEYKDSL